MLPQVDNYIPEDLMLELHNAVEHFAKSQKMLEDAMQSTEFRHQDRIDTATQEVRTAETEIEKVNFKIDDFLYAGEGHA